MIEVWQDIKGYENLYKISNWGNVMSLKRNKLMTPKKTKHGYITITLSKKGEIKTFFLHRLIAETFIPNPENKPYIDHINTIRDDNRVENLRWVTPSENNNNPLTLKRMLEITNTNEYKKTQSITKSKGVVQYTLDGKMLAVFYGGREASRKTGISQISISQCCRNLPKHISAGGYRWRYLDDVLADILEEIQNEQTSTE